MDPYLVKREMPSGMRHGLCGPEPPKQRDSLVGPRSTFGDGHTTRGKVAHLLSTYTHPHHEAAVGRSIDIGELFGDKAWRIQGEEQDPRPDQRVLGSFNQARQPHDDLRRRVGGRHVAADPKAVAPACSR